jgi:hypothetical protein
MGEGVFSPARIMLIKEYNVVDFKYTDTVTLWIWS